MLQRSERESGMALLVVIGLGVVMILLVATGMAVATSGLRQADTQQDSSGALDAAYAGVQDYLARINVDSNYIEQGNPSAPFSSTSSVTLPTTTNPAFGLGTTGTWATVPGSGGVSKFRYEVDTSAYATSGVVRLRATGLVQQSTRTIVSSFRVRGFIDYTYFTDYEIQDPQISGVPATCEVHAWEGRDAGCGTIRFGAFDNLNGRVHSNDTIIICGATFSGGVSTANPLDPLYNNDGCVNGPIPITRAAELPMPDTNSAMREDARCVYTGPTRVTYNADGTMTVVSPWTRYTGIHTSVPTNPAACGSLAALQSTTGATVPQLDADLYYVQSVPAVTSDPNYWAATAWPTGVACLGADANPTGNGTGVGWSFASGGTTIRFPLANEFPASNWRNGTQWSTTTPAYGCRNGDLYVRGRVTTPTTAASENYVYVIGDIIYADRTQDVFGLVGQNAVLVWNPIDSSNRSLIGDTGREIDAALVSVAHTFQAQNYNASQPRGTLTVFGSIAQKFRGPVATAYTNGTIATGYGKAYSYNPLMQTVSPPKFLAPSAVSFQLQRYAIVRAAFAPSGAAT